MASTSQSLRFLAGPATTGPGGGSFDALNRILADLCIRGNPKVSLNLSLVNFSEVNCRVVFFVQLVISDRVTRNKQS
jgi:FKBP12-rapamycin complex-associated protein